MWSYLKIALFVFILGIIATVVAYLVGKNYIENKMSEKLTGEERLENDVELREVESDWDWDEEEDSESDDDGYISD